TAYRRTRPSCATPPASPNRKLPTGVPPHPPGAAGRRPETHGPHPDRERWPPFPVRAYLVPLSLLRLRLEAPLHRRSRVPRRTPAQHPAVSGSVVHTVSHPEQTAERRTRR